MSLRLAQIKRADTQDANSQRINSASITVVSDAGIQGRADGQTEVVIFATGKREADKVGNLARSHRIIAAAERLERVNEQIVYSVQRFSRKQRRALR